MLCPDWEIWGTSRWLRRRHPCAPSAPRFASSTSQLLLSLPPRVNDSNSIDLRVVPSDADVRPSRCACRSPKAGRACMDATVRTSSPKATGLNTRSRARPAVPSPDEPRASRPTSKTESYHRLPTPFLGQLRRTTNRSTRDWPPSGPNWIPPGTNCSGSCRAPPSTTNGWTRHETCRSATYPSGRRPLLSTRGSGMANRRDGRPHTPPVRRLSLTGAKRAVAARRRLRTHRRRRPARVEWPALVVHRSARSLEHWARAVSASSHTGLRSTPLRSEHESHPTGD